MVYMVRFFIQKHNILCFGIDRHTNCVIMGITKRDKTPMIFREAGTAREYMFREAGTAREYMRHSSGSIIKHSKRRSFP